MAKERNVRAARKGSGPPEGFVERGFEVWHPEKGETLLGKYIGFEEIHGNDGLYKMHKLEDEDGQIHGVAAKGLDNRIEGIVTGMRIWLEYRGIVKTQAKRDMKDFRVAVDTSGATDEPPF